MESPRTSTQTSINNILDLPQELLLEIIRHFGPKHVHTLLLVNRAFYRAAYPRLWHTLTTSKFERKNRRGGLSGRSHGLCKLVDTFKALGPDAKMGFGYVKKLSFDAVDFWESSAWYVSGLLEIICDKLETGEMAPQVVAFRLRDGFEMNREPCAGMARLLKILREYPKLDGSRKLKISIDFSWYMKSFEFPFRELFALGFITSLRICRRRSSPRGGDTAELANRSIQRLTSLLKETSSLECLRLSGSPPPEDPPDIRYKYADDCGCQIEDLLDELQQLQAAITGLKRLEMIIITGLIFHPSFFITPPEKTTKLAIRQTVSFAWWRKFADCPFPNIKLLFITPRHIPPSKGWQGEEGGPPKWCSGDDAEADLIDGRPFVFKLEHLRLRGLRGLRTKWTTPQISNALDSDIYRPVNFLDLVLSNNTELEKYDREKYTIMNKAWKMVDSTK